MLTRISAGVLFAATLLCPAVAAQKKLTTLFAANNGGSSGWTCYFDIEVTNEHGIGIVGLEVNTNATATTVNTPVTIELYTCPTTFLGNEANIGAWTLQSTATGPASCATRRRRSRCRSLCRSRPAAMAWPSG